MFVLCELHQILIPIDYSIRIQKAHKKQKAASPRPPPSSFTQTERSRMQLSMYHIVTVIVKNKHKVAPYSCEGVWKTGGDALLTNERGGRLRRYDTEVEQVTRLPDAATGGKWRRTTVRPMGGIRQ